LDGVLSFIHFLGWTTQVTHIYREANFYADALTIRGCDVGFSLVMLDDISVSICLLLDKDLRKKKENNTI
jgi:hypothetical protein